MTPQLDSDLLAKYAPDEPSSNGHHPTNPGHRYKDRVLDVHAMLAQPDRPIPWRCEGLAADGFLTVLAGRGGEGKSWLALTLAVGVARGEKAAGITCEKGKAIIFDAENGPKLIARRFHAAGITADLGIQPVDASGLRVLDDLDWFRRTIVTHGANLVVFDSLKVLSSGAKENDSDAMEPIVSALKQLARDTDAAIVLIHHRGKGESSDYRGSSTILDQCDLLLALGRSEGNPEGRNRRKITTIKCRIDEEPEPRWVAIEADRARGLVCVSATDAYEAKSDRPRNDLRDDVLATLTGTSQPGARIAVAVGRKKTDGTVRRVLEDLKNEGLAEKRADGWGLPATHNPTGVATLATLPENGSAEPNQGLPIVVGNPGNSSQNGAGDDLAERIRRQAARPTCCCAMPGDPAADGRCSRCWGWPS
jgi:AAA domain